MCQCGCIVKRNYVSKHIQTDKHERWLSGWSTELSEPVKWDKDM